MQRAAKHDSMRAFRELSSQSKQRWLLTFRVLFAIVALLIACTCISFFRNAKELWVSRELIRSLNSDISGGRISEGLTDLDQLWKEIDSDRLRPDLLKRFGLYQGEKIHNQLEKSYFEGATRLLVNPVLVSVEHRVLMGEETSRKIDAVDALKLYQMIHRREHCDVDQAFFVKWASYLRNSMDNPTLDSNGRAISLKHFALLANPANLAKLPSTTLRAWNQEVVLEAKDKIGKTRNFRDVYAEIIKEASGETITLADILADEPERARQLLDQHESTMLGSTEVEGAFSIKAFNPVETALSNWRNHLGLDACVFGGSVVKAGSNNLDDPSAEQPTSLYVTAYKERWKAFLGSAKLKSFTTAEAPKRLEVLAGERSPLAAIFALASRHTSVLSEPNSSAAPKNATTDADFKVIDKMFDPVHRVISPGVDRWTGGWWNDSYRRHLLEMKDAMAEVVGQPSNRDAKKKAREVSAAALNAIELLQFPSGTEGVDRMVKDLLRAPFEIARVPEDGPNEINQILSGVCKDLDSLRVKFPFKSTAQQQATEEDVRRLFDPVSGSFLRFSTGGFVQRAGSGEAWQPGPQVVDFVLDQKFIDFLNRLSQTSRGLFSKGQTLGFQFRVRLSVTPKDMATELRIGGQQGRRIEGSDGVWQFEWPGPDPKIGFSLRTSSMDFDYKTVWGLYSAIQNNKRDLAANRVEISGRELPGGGFQELKYNGSPARVDLTFQDLPNGINGLFLLPDCPRNAAKR